MSFSFQRLSAARERDVSETQWLWSLRIPLGGATLLEGDPGTGKSTVTYDLCARVTTGAAMPLEEHRRAPASVVVLQGEDSGGVMRRQLQAAGADFDRVLILDPSSRSSGDLREALPDLERAAREEQATLVVIDPLTSFVSDGLAHESTARDVLGRLGGLAETLQVAVVGVRHLSKQGGRNPLHQGAGSIGLAAVARSILRVIPDPADRQRRLLVPIKSNWGPLAAAVEFTLPESAPLTRIQWLGERDDDLADLLTVSGADRRRLEEAMQFLVDTLQSGPQTKPDVLRAAARAGISERTLRRARETLRIPSVRVGFGPGATYRYQLPGELRGAPPDHERGADDRPPRNGDDAGHPPDPPRMSDPNGTAPG